MRNATESTTLRGSRAAGACSRRRRPLLHSNPYASAGKDGRRCTIRPSAVPSQRGPASKAITSPASRRPVKGLTVDGSDLDEGEVLWIYPGQHEHAAHGGFALCVVDLLGRDGEDRSQVYVRGVVLTDRAASVPEQFVMKVPLSQPRATLRSSDPMRMPPPRPVGDAAPTRRWAPRGESSAEVRSYGLGGCRLGLRG